MKIRTMQPCSGIIVLVLAVVFCLAGAGGAAAEDDTAIAGCALPVTSPDYSGGFELDDFDVSGILLDDNGDLALDTQSKQLDPSNIEIPIEQEVSVTFLYEGAGFTHSRFGWMYETDVDDDGDPDTSKIRWLYERINDNDNDGVLDYPSEEDTNGDGVKNAKDNKIFLTDEAGAPITFKAGTKLVFVLDSRLMYGSANPSCSSNSWCGGIFYTKQEWNEGLGKCTDTYSGISRIIRLYENGNEGSTACYSYYPDCDADDANCHTQGWMNQDAIDRLKALYGYEFRAPTAGDPDGFNEVELNMRKDDPSIHAILGAPNNTPNAWILGFDDTKLDGTSQNDVDFNDLVFLIERKTGGVARLKQAKAITPDDSDAFYTQIEFEVVDAMPCPGTTAIDYYYSVNYEKDADGNDLLDEDGQKIPIWYQIGTEENRWETVYSFTTDEGGAILDDDGAPDVDQTSNLADTWKAGNPVYTYRRAEIDLVAKNNVGRNLLWKAELRSESELCVPVVYDVEINGTVARHAFFSRSTPIIRTNIIYSGSYETPDPLDSAWMSDPELRGHLKAIQVYNPRTFETTPATDEDGNSNIEWDAGQVLKERNLTASPRKIYFPDMTAAEHTVVITDSVDGKNQVFTGTLESYPVLDGTFAVTAQTEDSDGTIRPEALADVYTNDILDTDTIGASGWINRFTGAYEIRFAHPPKDGTAVTLTYTSYTTTTGHLETWGTANEKLTDTLLNTTGTGIDKEKLIRWTLGFKDDGTERTWPLGPIDHSAAAVMTPPGIPAWYYAEGVPDELKNSFYDPTGVDTSTFAASYKDRKVIVFVGSLDGMLHAFDGGTFTWDDNEATDHEEERGHFVWTGADETTAQYGTGEELWAYIPGNLVPKMKNNYSKQDFSKALVDASPAICDVTIDNEWRTVVIFAQGSGGHMITCLDVTQPLDPTLLWEFGDPGLFRSQSSPAIGMVKAADGTGKWVSFWVSGYTHPDDDPSVYMVDVATGTLVGGAKIQLDAAGSDGLGGVGSGQPAIVDTDGDGYVDRFYVGTDKGFLYRVDISDIDNPADTVINSSERDADRGIYGSPAVLVDEGKVRIFFGTAGDAATTDSFTYKFYAYVDGPDGVSLDWSYALDAQERVYTSAFVAAGQVYFGTTTAISEDPCAAGGDNTGNLYAFKTELEEADETPAPVKTIPLPTGSGRVSPIVDDGHVYIKTTNGLLKSFGGPEYNTRTIGVASEESGSMIHLRSWREIYCLEEDCLTP